MSRSLCAVRSARLGCFGRLRCCGRCARPPASNTAPIAWTICGSRRWCSLRRSCVCTGGSPAALARVAWCRGSIGASVVLSWSRARSPRGGANSGAGSTSATAPPICSWSPPCGASRWTVCAPTARDGPLARWRRGRVPVRWSARSSSPARAKPGRCSCSPPWHSSLQLVAYARFGMRLPSRGTRKPGGRKTPDLCVAPWWDCAAS